MTDRLRLSPRHRRILTSLLREHLPDVEVWAYGSRVNDRGHEGSDLDLVLRGPRLREIPFERLMDFEDSVRESTIPFLVEARDWARLPEQFHREIEREYVVVVAGTVERDIRRAALADIIDLTLSSVDKKCKPGERPVRLCNYMDVYNNTFITDQLDFMVATATDREVARCSLARGDVIITKDSEKHDDIGVPALVRRDISNLVCGYHLAILRPRPAQVVGDYLVYALSAPQVQHQFHAYANGITRFGLRKADIGLVEVPLPSRSEQRAIAHILGTLDDKIELNRRMNETLEAMARALFKSWFVDFDPVRAKMEGRDTGLPQDIADLFPARMVDSEMGESPEGWEVFRLDELTHHHTRSTSPLRSPELEYEHFSIPAYDAGQRPAIQPGAAIRSNKTVVPDDAVLLSKLNPRIARVWMPPDSTGRPQVCSTEFLAFVPKPPANRSLLFALFADQHFRALLKSLVTGTSKSHQRVPPRALKSHEVLAGSPRLFAVFGEATGDILARILKNRSEAATLATLRDTLLPKLISGEIRLAEAEGATEAEA